MRARQTKRPAPLLRRRSTRKKAKPSPQLLPRVLFLANSEHGQTNLILALAHELLVRGDIDVHIASFPSLLPRLEKVLQDNISRYHPAYRSRIHFHPIAGPSNTEAFLRTGKRSICHPPGYEGALKGFNSLFEELWAWGEEDYLQVYHSCLEIVQHVDPATVIVDWFFPQGRDAAYNAGHAAIVLYTTSLSHIVYGLQPHAAWAWKFPMPGTDFRYPLPWRSIPANAMAVIEAAKIYRRSGRQRQIREWRMKHHIQGRFPFADAWRPDRFHLTPGLKELDWPFEVPDNVLPCGPILLPVASVKAQDPELDRWLRSAPTIMVNLGTLYAPDPRVARNIAAALRTFLDAWTGESNLQVLWKLPKHTEDCVHVYEEAVDLLRSEIQTGRVRIQPWFQVEPLSMLESGQIICSVHHGGANSWYEAIQTGVPHVVLPGWQDCYENAVRTEWLDIGVYANKTSAPSVDAVELSNALQKVVGNPSYQAKAAELSVLCRRKEGRVVGADKIAELVRNPERMALPIPGVDDINHIPKGRLQTIKNASGDTLETIQPPSLNIPLPTPIQNALELLIVAISTNTSFLLPILGYSLLIFPRLRLLTILYLIYIKWISNAPNSGASWLRNDPFRNSPLWTLYTSYFPIRLYRSVPLPPRRKYIFGYHPHGLSIRGAIGAFAANGAGFSSLFPGLTSTLLVSSKILHAPLLREYALSLGINSVSRPSCVNHLTKGGHDGQGMGNAITICIGGSREAAIAKPGTMDLILNIRRGFIRVAVQTGADLVPVLAFGENELFDIVDAKDPPLHPSTSTSTSANTNQEKPKSLLSWLPRTVKSLTGNDFRLIVGRFGVTIPFRKPVHVVVGKPIRVKESRWDQDEAYVAHVHELYVAELRRLWDEWRGSFGFGQGEGEVKGRGVEFRVVE
ncbi:diacylglycerol o-acyltransferase [Aspergillus heteromorphus CBS 117.55]|uniref:Diacylglycerol o-acyltransferase n=1 Tax=Aspergillus heteromorphus CBS 117.55 TaxID=1448321 RepID=A0A317WV09_9EURO|nr:diacylglycerol o-acyltransferase [Aspergillus heteromorphus CBS 117.55]PWY89142.1 diacylglycerol o-acyltransferase [Aspergillus heteromorphus CBS 117.55]